MSPYIEFLYTIVKQYPLYSVQAHYSVDMIRHSNPGSYYTNRTQVLLTILHYCEITK